MVGRVFIAGMVLAVVCVCGAGVVSAQQQGMSRQGIPFLSGGLGVDERAAIEAVAGQYNLKLEFALQEGNYAGDVRVNLRGPITLDAVSEGPWFLVRVPPGAYTATVEYEGVVKTQSVTVGGGLKTVVFRW